MIFQGGLKFTNICHSFFAKFLKFVFYLAEV